MNAWASTDPLLLKSAPAASRPPGLVADNGGRRADFGTTVIRRQLGLRLRQFRRAAGKSERDVDEASLMSRVKLWRVETGKVVIKVGDVRALCWLYGVDTPITDALARLASASREQGSWETPRDIGPDQHSLYTDLEFARPASDHAAAKAQLSRLCELNRPSRRSGPAHHAA
jgi:transcriptional regulator with XRE-family HTH domain